MKEENRDEKKKRETCIGERKIEIRKKKGGQIWVRERKLVKKNSTNFPKFSATQLFTFITSTKFNVK